MALCTNLGWVSSSRRLLLVHAHPDDETISTGGAIAKYAAEGAQVHVVTCTLGEDGEIIPPELSQLGQEYGDQLGGYRAGELQRACAVLGVTEQHYLGGIGRWRDSGMAGSRTTSHPRALISGAFDEQVAQLLDLFERLRPQVVVTYDSFGGYGHPDHIRAYQITMAAASSFPSVVRVFHSIRTVSTLEGGLESLRKASTLPFTMPELEDLAAVPDSMADTTLVLGEHRDTQIEALRQHATQISVWTEKNNPAGEDLHESQENGTLLASFALSDGLAQPIPDHEDYALAYGPANGVEFDLFGGL